MYYHDKTFQAYLPGLRQLRRQMEHAIKKLDGVQDAAVSFMTQRLTVEADDARFEAIMDQIEQVCKRVEPDCRIVRQ